MVVGNKVAVKQGTVVGGQGVLPNGKDYYYFQGIPYAVPPLRELRFLAPVPLQKFEQPEIQCTKEGDVSYQYDGNTNQRVGSEDCLFLNVYAPKSEPRASLPVMVFIHGGGFTFGSGNSDFYNPLYLIQEGVVVVTLNYRVGILGFLALPEANIPGNAGLKDQRLAMQWVHENIRNFNGDPNNITLFGHSAGGASVHWHVLSEKSRKFFNKTIIQSGTANTSWAADSDPSAKTKQFAQTLGCTSTNPIEIAKFFQQYQNLSDFIDPLLTKQQIEDFFNGRPVPIKPVVERESPEAVITQTASQTLNDRSLIDIPIMIGYTSAEGIIFLPELVNYLNDINRNIRVFVPPPLNKKLDDSKLLELATSIKNFYFKGQDLNKDLLNELADVMSDEYFSMGIHEAARAHSRKQRHCPLYFYRFDFVGALNFYKKLFQMEHLKGVSHADELMYIFQSSLVPEPWPEKEKKLVGTMCKLWTNFAKCSDPTPDKDLLGCTWEPIKKVGNNLVVNALIIDDPAKMVTNPDENRVAFWKNVQEKYNV